VIKLIAEYVFSSVDDPEQFPKLLPLGFGRSMEVIDQNGTNIQGFVENSRLSWTQKTIFRQFLKKMQIRKAQWNDGNQSSF
jgi:hypothetical protein